MQGLAPGPAISRSDGGGGGGGGGASSQQEVQGGVPREDKEAKGVPGKIHKPSDIFETCTLTKKQRINKVNALKIPPPKKIMKRKQVFKFLSKRKAFIFCPSVLRR